MLHGTAALAGNNARLRHSEQDEPPVESGHGIRSSHPDGASLYAGLQPTNRHIDEAPSPGIAHVVWRPSSSASVPGRGPRSIGRAVNGGGRAWDSNSNVALDYLARQLP